MKKKVEKPEAPSSGYHQCEWIDDSLHLRCQYPGTTCNFIVRDPESKGSSGGPWYCRAHAAMPDGRIGAQIVEASFKFRRAQPETEHDRKIIEDLKAWGLGQLAGETHHDWCMRMRDVAMSMQPVKLTGKRDPKQHPIDKRHVDIGARDAGSEWTQLLVEQARTGKKLHPVQEAMLLKALNLSRAELQELIWSAPDETAAQIEPAKAPS